MPRGGRRPGAGRKRKPLSWHLLAGTYKASRHGPKPAPYVHGATAPKPGLAADWMPAPADVEALGPVARAWLDAAVGLYRLSALEGLQLLAALRTLSRVEGLEATIRAEGITASTSAALAREQRVFLSQWAVLKLEGH